MQAINPVALNQSVAPDHRGPTDYYHPRAAKFRSPALWFVLQVSSMVAILFALEIAFPTFTLPTWWIALAFFLVMFFQITRVSSRFAKRVRSAVAIDVHQSAERLLAELIPPSKPIPTRDLRALAVVLRRTGRTDLTVRISEVQHADGLRPLDFLFEPIPLMEADSRFVEFERDGVADADRDAKPIAAIVDSEAIRKTRRNLLLSGGWFWSIVFGGLAALQIDDCLVAGTVNFELVFFGTLFVASFVGLFRKGAWGRTSKWLLVPGGVVVILTLPTKARSTAIYFRRVESVMTLIPYRPKLWSVVVANSAATLTTAITNREAEFLLRTWHSNAPSPTPEQVAGLAAG
jgi:hypothetical protein